MSASMAEVLAEHGGTSRIAGENEWDWCVRCDGCEKALFSSKWAPIVTMLSGASYERSAFIAHQAEQLAANGYGKLPEAVTEWASAFRATGVRYNYHHTKAEAEDFVKEMKDVGADMVVITRQHTPATSTEWRPQ